MMARAVPLSDTANNERPRKRLLAGFEHLKAGDLEAARETFAKIIDANPNALAAHLGLGRVYFQENDLQGAMQCCEQVLARDPKSSRAKILMARVREALGDYDAAVRDYQEAIIIDPSAAVAQRRLSEISAQNGNYEEALDRLRTILEQIPRTSPRVYCSPVCWNVPAKRRKRRPNCSAYWIWSPTDGLRPIGWRNCICVPEKQVKRGRYWRKP